VPIFFNVKVVSLSAIALQSGQVGTWQPK